MSQLQMAAGWVALVSLSTIAQARVWTDATGKYTLEAELVTANERTVVLQRADHELVAIPIDQLSEADREYLQSKEAGEQVTSNSDPVQTWTLVDGTKLVGRIVDFASRDITLQRRRGQIYVNDRRFENLPEFYQLLLPKIVARLESLQREDRRSLESWLIRQPGAQRTLHVDGVVLETADGDEYGIPFFMLSEKDLAILKPRYQDWQAAAKKNDYTRQEDHSFMLRSLAAARARDQQVQREIAMMQLKLQAVQAGVTSLWEVTLYPAAGQGGPPQWVVVAGRNSRDATARALGQHPGYVAGPVRRVSG